MRDESEIRLAMLISGGGSTMEAIIKDSQYGSLRGKIKPVVVISSRPDISGVDKARKLGIPIEVLERKQFEKGVGGSEMFGTAILDKLRKYSPNVLTQNGWLPLTPDNVVFAYDGNIFNQHPGPLDPDHISSDGIPLHFGGKGMHGLAVHEAVLRFQEFAGRSFPTEATIHKVTTQVDGGGVVYRREVPILRGDSAQTLAQRVLPVEHAGQIKFLDDLYDGRVVVLHRDDPLIHDDEEQFLKEAILFGRQSYPNG